MGFTLGLITGLVLALIAGVVAMRRLERRARLAERQAQRAQRMAEIGAMTSGLAHEIKNPLSTIGLNAELLGEAIDDDVPDPDARNRLTRRIDSIRREADRLRDILQDFLQFAGQVHLEASDHDLNAIVEEMVDFYLPQAQHHRVRLRTDLSPTPLPIHADSRLLKQAILNLMLNATQAMSPGTADAGVDEPPVTSSSDGAPRDIFLRTRRNDSARPPAAELHVIDTGPGMTPETIDKMFNPYFTTKPSGSGLGLPTTRRLIEAHDGTISVHSEVGRGTDFTIALPVREGAAV